MNNKEEKRGRAEPYIFIIDLDGTIIGDCNYQCDLYNIIELVKKYKMKGLNKYTALCNKYLNESYSEKSLLVRPHFFTFINAMKKLYPSSYFYIYTASEKKWANKEIAIIEKHNNFSEGEKQRIDMALMLTWRAVAKLKNSSNTNLLILDEVFDSSLDTNGTEELMKILHMLEDVNLFVISHKGDILVDKFTNIIRFEKVKNFSKVIK